MSTATDAELLGRIFSGIDSNAKEIVKKAKLAPPTLAKSNAFSQFKVPAAVFLLS